MSNQIFDRMILNPRERPLSSDINRLASELDSTLRTLVLNLYAPRGSIASDVSASPPTSFIGGGLKVRPESPVSMNVVLSRGIGFFQDVASYLNIDGISEVNDVAVIKPLVLHNPVTFTVPAAPAGPNTRYDIIEVRVARRTGDASSRDVLNTTSGVFEPATVNKTLQYTLDTQTGTVVSPANSTAGLSYKQGVAGNPGTVPATTAGYVKLAAILVGSAAASIDSNVIVDERRLFSPNGYIAGGVSATAPSGEISIALDGLLLPPGCLASTVWVSFSGNTLTYYLYIFAGQRLTSSPLVVEAHPISASNLTHKVTQVDLITVDSTIQAALAGVNASPALGVAVGQMGWRALISGGPFSSALTLHHSLMIPTA
jgi:hypothetical protein